MQYFLFTVSEKSWPEHLKTGIAAINDPGCKQSNRQGNAQKQKALCEVACIRKGDFLFFYYQQKKKVMGLYEAISKPFFDKTSLVKNGFIDNKYPIRVAFKQKINFKINIDMDDVWYSKDKGSFWSIQQQRGDTVGRHACISLTKEDGELLIKMFNEQNPIIAQPIKINSKKHNDMNLPFDYRCDGTKLHYEAVLQGKLLQDLRDGKHKTLLGNYDYCVPFFPTSSRKEIDILLFKHVANDVLWYEILELKQPRFTNEDLDTLMEYEKWLIQSLAVNARSVHSIAIANNYDDGVKEFIKGRTKYGGKNIRLIKYSFSSSNKSISLAEERI